MMSAVTLLAVIISIDMLKVIILSVIILCVGILIVVILSHERHYGQFCYAEYR
jgi:hypothetical protein